MERKIGEIFEYNGEWYQCVVSIQGCRECSFRTHDYCIHHLECLSDTRSDKTSVIFKKLEKVGEPYEHYEKLYQCYKLPMETEIRLLPDNCCPIGKDNLVEIEIKQNKEDMEEKKLNLKPFDIQKAREGKPVCTRDGRKARIICFDRESDASIVALIMDNNDREEIHSYYKDGKSVRNQEYHYDLMMLPEKKEGWVNVYKDSVYDTKNEALNRISEYRGYIDTIKVNWEE